MAGNEQPNPASQPDNNSEPRLRKWLKILNEGTRRAVRGKNNNPELLEQALHEASDESVDSMHSLLEYIEAKLERVSSNSGGTVMGDSLMLPGKRGVVTFGLPGHNFLILYGSRAERRNKTLDLRKYIDIVVEDYERRLAQGEAITNYKCYPLREAIEFILVKEHGFKPGTALNDRASRLEDLARDSLSLLTDPMKTEFIIVEGIRIPRTTDYGALLVFDVECYT